LPKYSVGALLVSEQNGTRPPLVTVYITNYNYKSYIEQAINSVLEQTYSDFELIIIDDGSTDGSRDIIRHYMNHDKVRVIFQENKGLNATNNIAIHAAHGKYIMRLDADDYLDENALLVMVNVIETSSDLAMVFPDYYIVDKNGSVTDQERRHDFKKSVTLLDQPAHGACTLVRRDCLLEVGAYNSKFTRQDGWDLWLKLTKDYSVRNVNLPLFYYRQHGKNLTADTERLLETRSAIYKAHAERSERDPLRCVAVIPERGHALDPHSQVLRDLGQKPLINWTIDAALAVPMIEEIVITTPDEELADHLSSTYGDRLTLCHRSQEEALENTSFEGSILQALKQRQTNFEPDAILNLTVESPFRSAFYLEKAINVMRIHDVCAVLGVMPEDDLFYRHDGSGLKPVGNNRFQSSLRLEREYLFRQSGGVTLIRWDHFNSGLDLLDGNVGHIVLSRRAALRVRDNFEMQLAQVALESTN
jgi:CMP-N-acetylneuraminic acid synthetase